MCQQIVQFCSGSTKPLLLAGSLLTLLLAAAIGYTACNTNALYLDLDPQVAAGNALAYYLQLGVSLYLLLITLLGCFAAHYDEKHSIRALAVVCSTNFVLAVVVILMLPSGQEMAPLFAKRLEEARPLYDFTDKPKPTQLAMLTTAEQSSPSGAVLVPVLLTGAGAVEPSTKPNRATRQAPANPQMDKATATKIWDSLQERGCCGFRNRTVEWPTKLPKSCCCEPVEKVGEGWYCRTPDKINEKPCIEVIASKSFNLLIISALIALINLYLATITGMSAFRTLHYNEASQSAYS